MLRIGHRGARGYEPPGNTIPSFRKALELGVDIIELDVHRCATGELVVVHDGEPYNDNGRETYVSRTSLSTLREIDLGNGQRIPTLDEVIGVVDRKAKLNVELKGKNTARAVADTILHRLQDGWARDDFLVSSFNLAELKDFHAYSPSIKTGVLVSWPWKHNPIKRINFAKDIGAHSVNSRYQVTPKFMVDYVHKLGMESYVWTVNEPEALDRMQRYGVDGIISDYPDNIPKNTV
ncbi:MAG: glycerophosphodiester phosphodiesterase [Candidatus Aenigmarchaeota archaeon]|nr:glycerophosphodiester phosphodiesterase [Candidatus Aenigmarchaeota archaeon]